MSLELPRAPAESSPEFYPALVSSLISLLSVEKDYIAQLANASAYLNAELTRINWIGFYILREGELVVGPFQGKVACTRIKVGKGVCGAAAQTKTVVVVDDVDAFPGHIACDSASRSEIVLPLFHEGLLVGVLDIDSPELARFKPEDASGLAEVAQAVSSFVKWPELL